MKAIVILSNCFKFALFLLKAANKMKRTLNALEKSLKWHKSNQIKNNMAKKSNEIECSK